MDCYGLMVMVGVFVAAESTIGVVGGVSGGIRGSISLIEAKRFAGLASSRSYPFLRLLIDEQSSKEVFFSRGFLRSSTT